MSSQIAILGDATEVMKTFRDKQFKIGIVDPPYFSGPEKRQYYGSRISSNKVKRVDYPVTETWEVPDAEYFKELFRVTEHQIIWGINYFDVKVGPGRIIWDKVNGDNSFSDCEIAYCSLIKSVRLFRYMWNGMLQGESITNGHRMQGNKKLNEKRIHPTQKPVNLYKWTFQKFVEPGWNILDTHLGSGSSRIAAYDMDMDFFGIEKSKIHFNRHEEWYEEYVAIKKKQLTLL